jgi:DNA relaxase NicK
MEASMKKILLLTAISGLMLTGCYSTQINMSMGNMRLITSSANPQDVMDFATKTCRDDFYEGASFLSKADKEYRFKCVKAEENEILIPIPGTTIAPIAKAEAK